MKRVYPDGKVPKNFKNWLLKTKSIFLDEVGVLKNKVEYVESFPFRESVKYKERAVEILDGNGNRILTKKIIRLY